MGDVFLGIPEVVPPTPKLSGLSLQVTDACNLACSYCYFYKKDPVTMSRDVVDRALDLLDTESDINSDSWIINLFGGEPTLRRDLVEYICETTTARGHAAGKKATFSLTTNGTRFDEKFLALARAYGISTMLSLDGNQKAHDRFRTFQDGRGSFDLIMKNLPRLLEAPNFKVRLTVSPGTVEFLAESIEELIDRGITKIASSVVVEETWHHRLRGARLGIKGVDVADTAEPAEICRPPRNYGCGAATTFVFVNAFGDIYPCHRYPGYFEKSPHVRLGSVHSGLDPARRHRYVTANLAASKKGCRSFVNTEKASGPCGDCAIQGACGGSCMAINEFVTGDPTQPPSVPGAIEQIKLSVMTQVHDYLAERAHLAAAGARVGHSQVKDEPSAGGEHYVNRWTRSGGS